MKMTMFRNELRLTDVPGSMIMWLNLSGAPSKFNMNGARSFELEIPEENARMLASQGWRVVKRGYDADREKFINTQDLDAVLDKELYKIKIKVNYDSKNPPKVYRVVDGKESRQLMSPSARNEQFDVGRIDRDDILSGDFIVNGWKNPNDGMVSAFLSFAAFIVSENEVTDKYSNYIIESDDGEVPFA